MRFVRLVQVTPPERCCRRVLVDVPLSPGVVARKMADLMTAARRPSRSGRLIRQNDRFAGVALDSGVVISAQPGNKATFRAIDGWHSMDEGIALVGLALQDGTPRWKEEGFRDVEVEQRGGGFFTADALRDSRTAEVFPGEPKGR